MAIKIWGGKRPNAGRKKDKTRRVQIAAYVLPRTKKILNQHRGDLTFGRMIDFMAKELFGITAVWFSWHLATWALRGFHV